MSDINDGGAAFPVSYDVANSEILNCMGMSLRDYFAAKAMQGYLTKIGIVGGIAPTDADMARYSYEMADAMLKARGES